MSLVDIAGVPSPRSKPADLGYEAECRDTLRPGFAVLLDMAEAAGWDRKRAAYAIMILAAHELTGGSTRANGELRQAA
jgi:hypothetical protein